ncbi:MULTISPECIES: DUF3817 domain-containing protein [unclassified Gordonia (in: high G+C Gram-positive bacteria)]|uniref:DUF3817 domain-containing protein n=1 Tax=unclassified Gordonia (in: high G+C Gram-positive bacteria) TaxID=2657482 RepID=UPI001FFFAD1E|nr:MULTISPECIES: DUF3817 domain-containing protein [unclassified Gordonia (in: high G+C Gram-positive bacteria)]UQE76395.1 DUF3817 domain-containing protein [Gordonia sp. PP30]
MTQTPTTNKPVTASVESIKSALMRYRVLAWVTGIWLLVLCVEMILNYGFQNQALQWVGPVHGAIYFVYLLMTLDLAMKVRWSLPKTIITLIAGTIPFVSFYMEHIRTQDVKKRFDLS